MSLSSRTLYHSPKYSTLILEEDGQKVVYDFLCPDDVNQLFAKRGFPAGFISAGTRIEEGQRGPNLLLFRRYEQMMPGRKQPEMLIWCCEVLPDRDAGPPVVLTPQEAMRKFGIKG